MYFDSHTHLNNDELYPHRQEHLNNFFKAGGIWLVNIGVNQSYNSRGIDIMKEFYSIDTAKTAQLAKIAKYSRIKYNNTKQDSNQDGVGVRCTIGLHPYEVVTGDIVESNVHIKIKEMCALYAPHKELIVGIGECGIDTNQEGSEHTLETQKDLFRQQCDLARQWGLPIVIHSRANRKATHEVLQNFKDLMIYFHCRSYTPDEIKIIKATYPSFYIGFCGNISYPKAIEIRQSLRYLVHENEDYPDYIISGKVDTSYKVLGTSNKQLITNNLLIETDAPYLAPQSHRGETNTPALIWETYKYISSLLGTNIAPQVVENAKRCYGL